MNSASKRVIVIRQTPPFRLLPKGIANEVIKTIGSKWKKGTRGRLKGITPEEELYLLPSIIQVPPNSEHWVKAVDDFFINLAIHVDPEDGIELNVTTRKQNVTVQGEEREVDFPEIPLDYIMWKQALADKSVANRVEQLNEGTFSFYIEDKAESELREARMLKDKNRIEKAYLDLVEIGDNGEFVKAKTMRHVLFVFGINPQEFNTADQVSAMLNKYKEAAQKELQEGIPYSQTQFIQIISDPHLAMKAFINALIAKGFLNKEGNHIVDSDNYELVLGNSLEQAALWMKNPVNSAKFATYKMKMSDNTITA